MTNDLNRKLKSEEILKNNLPTIEITNMNPIDIFNDGNIFDIETHTMDLLKSAAAILNETNLDAFDFENEMVNIDDDQLFIDTSTPNEQFLIECSFKHETDNIRLLNKTHSIHNSNQSLNLLCDYEFEADDYVCINKRKFGFIKYVGNVHFANGVFCGIELEEPDGKHDGIIDEKR